MNDWEEVIKRVKENVHSYESISLANDDVEILLNVIDDMQKQYGTETKTETIQKEKN